MHGHPKLSGAGDVPKEYVIKDIITYSGGGEEPANFGSRKDK
jgi:hypothetical protein